VLANLAHALPPGQGKRPKRSGAGSGLGSMVSQLLGGGGERDTESPSIPYRPRQHPSRLRPSPASSTSSSPAHGQRGSGIRLTGGSSSGLGLLVGPNTTLPAPRLSTTNPDPDADDSFDYLSGFDPFSAPGSGSAAPAPAPPRANAPMTLVPRPFDAEFAAFDRWGSDGVGLGGVGGGSPSPMAVEGGVEVESRPITHFVDKLRSEISSLLDVIREEAADEGDFSDLGLQRVASWADECAKLAPGRVRVPDLWDVEQVRLKI
jgi:hypothetical protein